MVGGKMVYIKMIGIRRKSLGKRSGKTSKKCSRKSFMKSSGRSGEDLR